MRKNKIMTKIFAGMMVTALVFQSTPMAPVSAQAAQKKVVIKTQKQLDAALKNKNVTAIEVRTTSGTTFTIKRGDYDKSIVVNSTNAKVVNNGEFKSVTIKNATSFTEKADNNKINVTDKNLNLTVSKGADNSKITVSSTGGKVNVKADGKVATVSVNKKTTLKVSGSTPKAVKITSNATGASINVASKANVQLNKSSVVNVTKGGQVEKVEVKGSDAKVNVEANATVGIVEVNAKAKLTVTGTTTSIVKVEANTKGTAITTNVKTEIVANADVDITIEKGAEGSNVKVKKEDVTSTIYNKSAEILNVTDSKGTETKLDAGKTLQVTPDVLKPEEPVTPPLISPVIPSETLEPDASVERIDSLSVRYAGLEQRTDGKYDLTVSINDEMCKDYANLHIVEVKDGEGNVVAVAKDFVAGYTDVELTLVGVEKLVEKDYFVTVTRIYHDGDGKIYAMSEPSKAVKVLIVPQIKPIDQKSLKANYSNLKGTPTKVAQLFNTLSFKTGEEIDGRTTGFVMVATGQLKYIKNFEGFAPDRAIFQEGYYLPVQINIPNEYKETATISVKQRDENLKNKNIKIVKKNNVFTVMIWMGNKKTGFAQNAIEKRYRDNPYRIYINWDGRDACTLYTIAVGSLTFEGLEETN